MDLTEYSVLKNLLKKYHIWAEKRLGQNFLVDQSVLDAILEAGAVEEGETVVEIGPGAGVLTQALLRAKANVEAVEIDGSIIPALKESTRSNRDRLSIINAHVLDYTPPEKPYKLISNIPYHLTSPILRKFLNEEKNRPSRIVFLIQKEVAEKICEKEGRDSHLSLMVKCFGTPTIKRIVQRTSFFPEPKVDSAVLVIELFKKPLLSIPPKIFEEMLFHGFSEPRKKLRNVLMKRFLKTGEEIEKILKTAGISGDLRAQNLSIKDWECLARVLMKEYF